MAVFNIFGMCILRDTFSFVPCNRHTVQHFLQWSHPANVFIFNNKPERTLELKHFGHDRPVPNFKERCVLHDYNRNVLDYYEKPSDFFMLDLTTMVHTHLLKETQSDGSFHYITNSLAMMENMNAGLKEGFFADRKLTPVTALDILAQVGYETIIDKYLEWLRVTKGYRNDQIILVENRSVHHYTDGESLFELHLDFRKENEVLKKCYAYFKQQCPGCHVIRMPCNVYADLHHNWGLTDLHLCMEYYDYLYACFDAIATGANCDQEIDRLYEDYSQLFMENIYRMIRGSFQYLKGENLIRGSLTQAVRDLIAPKGTPFYAGNHCTDPVGTLPATVRVVPCGDRNAKFQKDGVTYYVDSARCLRGYTGSEVELGNGWRTMNPTTQVQFTGTSVIVSHNGQPSKHQTQILYTVDSDRPLHGQPVTLSVYARVLKPNKQGKGGSIALINDTGYNKGIFLAHKVFSNTAWERISITFHLPKKASYRGLTVCLRAVSSSDVCSGAVVEFRDPKLEIGAFPTAISL